MPWWYENRIQENYQYTLKSIGLNIWWKKNPWTGDYRNAPASNFMMLLLCLMVLLNAYVYLNPLSAMGGTLVQQAVLLAHSFRVPGWILSLDSYLCGVFVHFLCACSQNRLQIHHNSNQKLVITENECINELLYWEHCWFSPV